MTPLKKCTKCGSVILTIRLNGEVKQHCSVQCAKEQRLKQWKVENQYRIILYREKHNRPLKEATLRKRAKKIESTTKLCNICGDQKDKKKFRKLSRAIDGYRSQCKQCEKTYRTESINNLSSGYIKRSILKMQGVQIPDAFIELKRLHLKAKRKIKQLSL